MDTLQPNTTQLRWPSPLRWMESHSRGEKASTPERTRALGCDRRGEAQRQRRQKTVEKQREPQEHHKSCRGSWGSVVTTVTTGTPASPLRIIAGSSSPHSRRSLQGGARMRQQALLPATWSLHPRQSFLMSQLPPLQSRAIISTQDEGCENEG